MKKVECKIFEPRIDIKPIPKTAIHSLGVKMVAYDVSVIYYASSKTDNILRATKKDYIYNYPITEDIQDVFETTKKTIKRMTGCDILQIKSFKIREVYEPTQYIPE